MPDIRCGHKMVFHGPDENTFALHVTCQRHHGHRGSHSERARLDGGRGPRNVLIQWEQLDGDQLPTTTRGYRHEVRVQ